MAGTKQIRYGRIERKIEDLELLLKVYKDTLKMIDDQTSFNYGCYFGKVQAVEMMINSLKELGAPSQSVERGADEGGLFK